MFITVINKMLFYFYKYHSSPMKTSVSMAYMCIKKVSDRIICIIITIKIKPQISIGILK